MSPSALIEVSMGTPGGTTVGPERVPGRMTAYSCQPSSPCTTSPGFSDGWRDYTTWPVAKERMTSSSFTLGR